MTIAVLKLKVKLGQGQGQRSKCTRCHTLSAPFDCRWNP